MNPFNARAGQLFYGVMAIVCIALLSLGNSVALAQQTDQQIAAPAEEAPKIPNDQLDSLVAPIALYPDPLLRGEKILIATGSSPVRPAEFPFELLGFTIPMNSRDRRVSTRPTRRC